MKYLGNFSAVEPVHSRDMYCYECEVCWTGCWDNFQCPKCGQGDIPKWNDPESPFKFKQLLGGENE